LKFAQRAKTIKNNIQINVKLTYEELQKQNMKLQKDLTDAKNEIEILKTEIEKMDFVQSKKESHQSQVFNAVEIKLIDLKETSSENYKATDNLFKSEDKKIIKAENENKDEDEQNNEKEKNSDQGDSNNTDSNNLKDEENKEVENRKIKSSDDLGFSSKRFCNLHEEHTNKIEKLENELNNYLTNLKIKEVENADLLSKIESLKSKISNLNVNYE